MKISNPFTVFIGIVCWPFARLTKMLFRSKRFQRALIQKMEANGADTTVIRESFRKLNAGEE
jgi:hypothetical protein